MNPDERGSATPNGSLSETAQRIPRSGLLVAAGILVGVGVVALVRGVHIYIHFHSYASGIATSRLVQTLFWAVTGGIVLAAGIVLLVESLRSRERRDRR